MMKSIILYESKSGCTEKCAAYIKENNESEHSKITNFKGTLNDYESIVIMGPVYMGKVNDQVLKILNRNKELLLSKKLYIVLCGMNVEGFNAMVEQNIDEQFRNHAEIIYGGGAYYLEKLGFIKRRIVKAIAKVTQSSEHINYQNLDKIKI